MLSLRKLAAGLLFSCVVGTTMLTSSAFALDFEESPVLVKHRTVTDENCVFLINQLSSTLKSYHNVFDNGTDQEEALALQGLCISQLNKAINACRTSTSNTYILPLLTELRQSYVGLSPYSEILRPDDESSISLFE